MRKTALALFFAVVAIFCLGVTGFAADKTYKLRLATVVTPPHPWVSAAEYFAKEVEEKTDGHVKVSVYTSSSLGSDQTTIDGMRMGTVDLVFGGVSPASTFVPEFAIFTIPYLFSDYDVFNKAMANDSPVFKHFEKIYADRKLGLKLLALCGGGVRDVSNNLNPVVKPEDMKGMKMRVPTNPIVTKIWSTTGALPSPMAWKEIYSAIQTGVVNCFDSSISGYYGSRYYEVAPYHSKTQHQFMVSHISMSVRAFNKLPKKYQDVILEVGKKAGRVVTDKGIEFDELRLKELVEKYNVKVNEVDKATWCEHFSALQDELAASLKGTKEGPSILKELRSIK